MNKGRQSANGHWV